jgi:hypothetical protein
VCDIDYRLIAPGRHSFHSSSPCFFSHSPAILFFIIITGVVVNKQRIHELLQRGFNAQSCCSPPLALLFCEVSESAFELYSRKESSRVLKRGFLLRAHNKSQHSASCIIYFHTYIYREVFSYFWRRHQRRWCAKERQRRQFTCITGKGSLRLKFRAGCRFGRAEKSK